MANVIIIDDFDGQSGAGSSGNVPYRVDDGKFSKNKRNGSTSYSFPFANKGDHKSFEAVFKRRCDVYEFVAPRALQKVTFPIGVGFLVDFSNPAEVGPNLIEWEETYASLPVARSEYTSITYTQQWLERFADNTAGIAAYTATRDARILYEYNFRTPLPPILAPRLVDTFGAIISIGGYSQNYQEGQDILAQDTTSEIYKGLIYCRKSVFVKFTNRILLDT